MTRFKSYYSWEEIIKQYQGKFLSRCLILLDKNWPIFFQAIRAYNECPSKFKSRPQWRLYKDKKKGRNILVYTKQGISKPQLVKN